MEYKRIEGETPSGGDYSDIWYLDDQENVVDEKFAARCIINERKQDGTLVISTRGLINHTIRPQEQDSAN